MPVDPLVQVFLDQIASLGGPKTYELSPIDARQGYDALASLNGPVVDVASVVDDKVDGAAGPIPVRIYTPTSGDGGTKPVVVHFHGGGWTLGGLNSHDAVCRLLAEKSGAIVVAVDYRLAPEHPYPAAVEDAWAALQWVSATAGSFGGDRRRIAVAGDSAGGNLAAVVALRARDAGAPELVYQLLVYPVVDLTATHRSYVENGSGYLLERSTMEWFRANYVGDPPRMPLEAPELSPLHAPDLAGVAPALVITAEFDPLRDEGEAYAARLADAGVDARASRYDGMIHAFWGMGSMWPKAADAMTEATTALRQAFGSV